MQLNQLTRSNHRKDARRIGRGGKRGKMSGRGHKGQTARAGNSTRPEMREQIKKIPKLRGHGVNRAEAVNAERVRAVAVNLSALENAFTAGDTVSPKTLVAKKVISAARKRAPLVKILATGEITKKLIFVDCQVSMSARAKIEKAGGEIK